LKQVSKSIKKSTKSASKAISSSTKAAPVKKSAAKAAPAKKPAPPAKKPAAKAASAKKPAPPAKKPAAKAAPAKKPAPAAKAAPAKKPAPPAKKPAAKAAPAKKPAPPAKKPAPPAKKPAPPAKKPALPPKKPAAKAAPAKKPAPPAEKPAAKPAPAKKPAPQAASPPAPKPVAKPAVVVKTTPGGPLYYDSHMHTPLCKHAWGEPEEYAAQALKAGLKGIIFTCHCPMPNGFWPSVRMSESEFDTYIEIVRRAAKAYEGRLDVCLGLESEFFPGCEDWIRSLHERADFDYILGGLHWQAKEYLAKFEVGTIENFRRTYFEHLAQSAESGLYDCLAHPDLVKNYHPDSWCFAIVKNSAEAALDRIAQTGVAMELNTSGLNKSYSEMNPGNEMLRMMAERGIPVVIGSDAHRANRVGEHFITALNNLTEAGYETVSYFQKRQRIDLKISDVLSSIKRAADANL
jgi:HisJ family histidinol phosphate phosphatase